MSKRHTIKKACVVIPTYNEAKNISSLLEKLYKEHKKASKKFDEVELHVLVVDDSSPDGTGKVVKKIEKKNPKVHLLSRKEKTGLGAAYIAGMQHAIKLVDPDVILEMDADHSHNPKDVFRLIEAIRDGADFAIGSRYVKGGKTPENWGLHRKITSKLANIVTKVLLGVRGVSDISGGFRAIHTDLLSKVDWDNLNVRGYAFQAVLLEESQYNGAKVVEIPITFTNREEGKSKMTIKDMIEPFKLFSSIRWKRLTTQTKSHLKEAKA